MSEEKNKTLKLSDLINITKRYLNKEINDEEMVKFGGQMTIRNYIPLQEKIDLIMSLMVYYKYPPVYSQEIRIGELYKNIFFYVVLSGYAMVDCISEPDLITFETYDLLYPIFNQFITGFCSEDYKTTISFLHDTINMYSVMDMEAIANSLDEDKMKEAAADGKYIINKLEEDNNELKDLKDLVNLNDPTTVRIMEDIKERAQKSFLTS